MEPEANPNRPAPFLIRGQLRRGPDQDQVRTTIAKKKAAAEIAAA